MFVIVDQNIADTLEFLNWSQKSVKSKLVGSLFSFMIFFYLYFQWLHWNVNVSHTDFTMPIYSTMPCFFIKVHTYFSFPLHFMTSLTKCVCVCVQWLDIRICWQRGKKNFVVKTLTNKKREPNISKTEWIFTCAERKIFWEKKVSTIIIINRSFCSANTIST